MVHLQDVETAGAGVNVLLGKGIAKIPEVIAELKKVNYTGLLAIEYEKEGPVNEEVRIEVEWARQLI
jgi:sugar phosphate isomerase/epimerase